MFLLSMDITFLVNSLCGQLHKSLMQDAHGSYQLLHSIFLHEAITLACQSYNPKSKQTSESALVQLLQVC